MGEKFFLERTISPGVYLLEMTLTGGIVQGCMQTLCRGGGGKLGIFKKEGAQGAQLQAASEGVLEDNVKN